MGELLRERIRFGRYLSMATLDRAASLVVAAFHRSVCTHPGRVVSVRSFSRGRGRRDRRLEWQCTGPTRRNPRRFRATARFWGAAMRHGCIGIGSPGAAYYYELRLEDGQTGLVCISAYTFLDLVGFTLHSMAALLVPRSFITQ